MSDEVDDSYSWIVWGVPLIVVLFLCCVFVLLYLLRRHVRGPMYKGHALDMTGKVVVITGANTGIGKITAEDMARRGAKVYMLCRNLDKGFSAAREVSHETGTSVEALKLDLSSFVSIRECAENLKEMESKIHVLINNAGVMMCPQWETKDGLEMQIGTNHFGHFLLTLLLLDNIKAAAPSRIVTLSSMAHQQGKMNWNDLNMKKDYSPLKAYGQSKLANVLFSRALAKKLKGTEVTTYAVHPGFVATELARHVDTAFGSAFNAILNVITPIFYKTPVLGAQTTIACVVDDKIGKETGKYYCDCKKAKHSKRSDSDEDAERLWNISLDIVGLDNFQV